MGSHGWGMPLSLLASHAFQLCIVSGQIVIDYGNVLHWDVHMQIPWIPLLMVSACLTYALLALTIGPQMHWEILICAAKAGDEVAIEGLNGLFSTVAPVIMYIY